MNKNVLFGSAVVAAISMAAFTVSSVSAQDAAKMKPGKLSRRLRAQPPRQFTLAPEQGRYAPSQRGGAR